MYKGCTTNFESHNFNFPVSNYLLFIIKSSKKTFTKIKKTLTSIRKNEPQSKKKLTPQ